MDCKGEECEKYWSCKYLQFRFGVMDEKYGYNPRMVDFLHILELEDREKILRGIKRG